MTAYPSTRRAGRERAAIPTPPHDDSTRKRNFAEAVDDGMSIGCVLSQVGLPHASNRKEGGLMQPFPHHYNVTVTATETAPAQISSPGLNTMLSAPPAEFDGPGNLWSPETLTVAAVADCLILTFRAIASVSRLRWTKLVCDGKGAVDRSDGVIRFTAIQLHAHLVLPAGTDAEKARRLLEKAENACLVGNSLKFAPALEAEITFEDPALAPSA
jgi:peroxiredoxin-like protein